MSHRGRALWCPGGDLRIVDQLDERGARGKMRPRTFDVVSECRGTECCDHIVRRRAGSTIFSRIGGRKPAKSA